LAPSAGAGARAAAALDRQGGAGRSAITAAAAHARHASTAAATSTPTTAHAAPHLTAGGGDGGDAGSTPSSRRAAVLDVVRAQAGTSVDAFYVVDLREVARKHAQWAAELPRVRPYYAVKCNDDPAIVRLLASLGAGFDCASKGEMAMVLGCGVPASDIIFAHPAKQVRGEGGGTGGGRGCCCSIRALSAYRHRPPPHLPTPPRSRRTCTTPRPGTSRA
jgi:hypothetical protein